MKDFRKKILIEERNENDFIEQDLSEKVVDILKEKLAKGEELPKGYSQEDGRFYYDQLEALEPEERLEVIAHQQLQVVKTIRSCVVFFTVITVISLILSFLVSCVGVAGCVS